jgi:hypothetical protein
MEHDNFHPIAMETVQLLKLVITESRKGEVVKSDAYIYNMLCKESYDVICEIKDDLQKELISEI